MASQMDKSTCWESLDNLIDSFHESYGSLPEELTLDVVCYEDLMTEMAPIIIMKGGDGHLPVNPKDGDMFAGIPVKWRLPPRERRHIRTITASRGDHVMSVQEVS